MMDAKASPTLANPDAEAFYTDALRQLTELGCPFLVSGTYAVSAYTGISRETKDLDIFCKAGDSGRILTHFGDQGYVIRIEDDRWLGKVCHGPHFFDVIFASSNGTMPVGEQWFDDKNTMELFGSKVRVVAPTELIWSKCFIQNRTRYDGADVAHLILMTHDQIDWRKLLEYMEVHWEVLLTHLINFRWIYPTERDCVPAWLLDELLARLEAQRKLPLPEMKVCRGRMLSRADYEIDVREWGFADVGGEGEWRDN